MIAAPPSEWARAGARDAQPALNTLKAISLLIARERVQAREVLKDYEALEQYLRLDLGFQTREHFRVLYLDSGRSLITDELIAIGTIDQVAIQPRDIISRALQMGAVNLIVAHNHPSGLLEPSDADCAFTTALLRACETMQIGLLDHIIVARGGTFSLREQAGLWR